MTHNILITMRDRGLVPMDRL